MLAANYAKLADAKVAESRYAEAKYAEAKSAATSSSGAPIPDTPRVLGLLPGPAIGIAAPFGRWSADDLDLLADAAEHAGNGELRLTPWRAILLPGVDPAHGAALLEGWAGRFVIRHGDRAARRRRMPRRTGLPERHDRDP